MAIDRDQEFSTYVAAHRGRMVRIARLLTTGDAHWAEDLVQTALTKLYLKWHRVSPELGPPAGPTISRRLRRRHSPSPAARHRRGVETVGVGQWLR
ncbi:hypothetical protein F1D05_14810 [Kribbella qitaiheensis]|uniref:RNA polymerase sigma-70 region 2 domain-containing protein n=1 Tax=Kribbella qitaiheensis TaxID=1544730 RepID=A0A7G6WY85_9ACTN|nr:sigma factor [Kribbella qitaiheensis]QNE18950.1 hypothetical protein F1D05_14810 [Kribbella qitaiheensis]